MPQSKEEKKVAAVDPDTVAGIDANKLHPNCIECGRWKTCQTPFMVPTAPKGPPSLHIVGEGPGSTEDRLGKQFLGPAGHIFRAWMEEVGLDPATFSWDNAVKCGTSKPTLKQIRLCRPFTLRNLMQIKPRSG